MVNFNLVDFSGTGVDVNLVLTDVVDPGGNTGNFLEAFLEVDTSTGVTGDLFGLFLALDENNLAPTFNINNYLNETDFANLGGTSYVIGADVTGVGSGTNAGGGNNINGIPLNSTTFIDLNFTFGTSGSSSGLLTSTSVYLRDLDVFDVLAAGARLQTVGSVPNGGGGSAKLFGYPDGFPPPNPDPDAVPEPATLTLFGAALVGLAFMRKRRG